MKRICSAFILSVVSIISLSIAPAALSQTSSDESVSTLFNQTSVDAVISVAYQTKSTRYSEFAQLFNLCQKHPVDERCGEEYKLKKSHYEIAKSNHGALVMVNTPEFRSLFMPPVNYPEFVGSLTALGYLSEEQEQEKLKQEQVLAALNQWLDLNGFDQTTEIYFMHALLVRAQELSQQLDNRG
ncbi:hypothetical protein KP803_09305 [Vibrio sp. ZSDE26]|uniref:Uncharacterized protein n=1 Tax=Vibrio amylolyticus TaxID=2847292 RepID=A0A9X1XQ22_9VIBR|nr:hypothetical protein [Vibrio amylolyticus]MCK6263469.1 hypothetical protein [Vibrio amylolyticus]